MSVFSHRYRVYEGDRTAAWQRWMVLPRYSYRVVFQSKFFLVFFVLCFLAPLGGAVIIYLKHNLAALETLQISPQSVFPIDAMFFLRILSIQGTFAFLLTVLVGPGLVSPDLTNNALCLYLSRPFSSVDYVLGKMSVLLILQMSVTWLPLSLLFLLQGSMAESGWLWENRAIFAAVLVGSLIWCLFLSVFALAVSAWVRWRPIAGALLFGSVFIGSGLGQILKEIFASAWGELLSPLVVIDVIWSSLFAVERFTRVRGLPAENAPVWSAWLVLLGMGCFCLLLLYRRIRAFEVVK